MHLTSFLFVKKSSTQPHESTILLIFPDNREGQSDTTALAQCDIGGRPTQHITFQVYIFKDY